MLNYHITVISVSFGGFQYHPPTFYQKNPNILYSGWICLFLDLSGCCILLLFFIKHNQKAVSFGEFFGPQKSTYHSMSLKKKKNPDVKILHFVTQDTLSCTLDSSIRNKLTTKCSWSVSCPNMATTTTTTKKSKQHSSRTSHLKWGEAHRTLFWDVSVGEKCDAFLIYSALAS